jgi:hypothetical protein
MDCVICKHPERKEIEEALLSRGWGDPTVTLQALASQFKVPLQALQIHSVVHFSMPTIENPTKESISDKVKFREAELLRETAAEYYYTLKNLGVRINSIVSGEPIGLKLITSPLVELYLGTGKNLKEAVEGLVKLDQWVHGENDKGLQALGELVGAIRASADSPSTSIKGDFSD